MANYYYRNGEITNGPFSLVEMELLIRTRQVGAKTLVCQETVQQWMDAATFIELDAMLPTMKAPRKTEDPRERVAVTFAALLAIAAIVLFFVSEKNPDIWPVWIGVIASILCGIVGNALGATKARGPSGFLLGSLLGPLGWVLILHIADGLARCPICRTVVSDGVQTCPSCRHLFLLESSLQPKMRIYSEGDEVRQARALKENEERLAKY